MNFIRDEKGQGLVEYALILVLVAIVVIAVQLLLGPIIEICSEFCPVDNVNTPENTPVEINYFSNNIALPGPSLQIESEPDHGSAVITPIAGGGPSYIVTYTPQSGFSGVDSFGVARCSLFQETCESITQYVTVGPSTGIPGPMTNALANDRIQDQAPQPGTNIDKRYESRLSNSNAEWDELYDQLYNFINRVNQQTRSIIEARALMTTAFEGIVEILNGYAVESGNGVLQDGIAALVQAVAVGDETAVYTAITNMGSEIALAPAEVKTAILIEAGPYIADTYLALYGVDVAAASFETTLQMWIDQEENEPGSTSETIPWLTALWEHVEERNQLIEYVQPLLKEGALLSIELLWAEEETSALARQLNDNFYWGSLAEAIDKADIDNYGIRTSLFAKANAARSAYNDGKLIESGKKLCNLLNYLNVQEAQHIDPDSANLIRESVLELNNGIEIPMNCSSEG